MTAANTARKGNILVVEDEKALRDVYKIILSTAGYAVQTANDGKEGLEALTDFTPDFVLLDVFMPVMNGLDFMRALKPAQWKKMAVVVFSNNSDSGVRDEANRLGARDVVLKADIAPGDLVALVSKYLN